MQSRPHLFVINSDGQGMSIAKNLRIGVDVGGTFTDMVLVDDRSAVSTFKVPSVPEDPSQGVLNVLRHAARQMDIELGRLLGRCRTFIHGSTIATNTLL